MFQNVDTQALFRLIRNNEAAEGFDFETFTEGTLGTYGCLVGNDLLAEGVLVSADSMYDELYEVLYEPLLDELNEMLLGRSVPIKQDRYYRLPSRVFVWLFQSNEVDTKGVVTNVPRRWDDKAAALVRVRKFLYYYLHRQELMPSRDTKEGREQYDRARRLGDVGITAKVLEKVMV